MTSRTPSSLDPCLSCWLPPHLSQSAPHSPSWPLKVRRSQSLVHHLLGLLLCLFSLPGWVHHIPCDKEHTLKSPLKLGVITDYPFLIHPTSNPLASADGSYSLAYVWNLTSLYSHYLSHLAHFTFIPHWDCCKDVLTGLLVATFRPSV